MSKRSAPFLLLSVGFLLGIGIVMLISTCAFSEGTPADDIYKDAKRQLVWILGGVAACAGAACLDYRWMQKGVWWLVGGTAILLILCYVPGIGREINGEWRWIRFGGFQFQPSELAKVTVAVFLAYWFALHADSGARPVKGFLIPVGVCGVLIALVLFEKDMGTAAVLSVSCLSLLFAAGVRWYYLTGLVSAGLGGLVLMVKFDPHRMGRIMAYLDMEANKLGFAFQQWIGLMALGSGGPAGRGLGEGRLKMLYMPFAHTDFIFPMIGEELGLPFTLLVVFAFLLFAVSGIAIAFHAPDSFGKLLGLGLVCFIVAQAALNIGVTTAVLPNTGIPLPFISYGGTAMVSLGLALGILMSVARSRRLMPS